jgi:hypothetical protein
VEEIPPLPAAPQASQDAEYGWWKRIDAKFSAIQFQKNLSKIFLIFNVL